MAGWRFFVVLLAGALALIFSACTSGPKPGADPGARPGIQVLPPVSTLSAVPSEPALDARPTPTPVVGGAAASMVPTTTLVAADGAAQPQRRGGFGVRYGVIVQSPESPQAGWFAEKLGVLWFLNEGRAPAQEAGSSRKVPIIKEIRPGTYLSREQMAGLLQDHPGVDLVLGNEPNVGAQGNSTGAEYAEAFHYYNGLLKGEGGLDPHRRLVAGNTLNWEFTCLRKAEGIPEPHGCTWDYSGREFVTEFRAAYKVKFGVEPPVEVWGVHSYPMDWKNLPTTNTHTAIEQIVGMRSYLDSSPDHKGVPMWVTEFGVHWGYGCGDPCFVEKNGLPLPGPGATYREAAVLAFMNEMLDWLESRGEEDRVERWFLYAAYVALGEPNPQINQGLTLFQGPDQSSGLSAAGQLYRRRATTR